MRMTAPPLAFLCAVTASLPLGAAPAPELEELVYVPDTSRWVAMQHGDTFSVGKLAADGTFLPDPLWVNRDIHRAYTSAPAYTLINALKGRAYEYRSGRLILGELDDNGIFIPQLGGKIISLDEYLRSPTKVPIYNLPGRLVKKEQKDGK